MIRRLLDGGTPGGDDGSAGDVAFDGTTGKTCASDADCVSATGPGINACSSDFDLTITGVNVAPWSTPVCLIPPVAFDCDPAPAGQGITVRFCDGPDVATSPGLCVPADPANPQPGQGTCYPQCTMKLDGSKPTGCAGTNACNLVWLDPSTTPVTGIGYCQGGCQTDADCAALGPTFGCQTDIGFCTAKKVARTKPVGAACSISTDGGPDDGNSGACDCVGASSPGFCSSSCIVGGTACPNGWLCDGRQTAAPFTSVTVTAQNTGIPGVCLPPCMATDGGTTGQTVSDASADNDAADGAAVGVPEAGATAGQCPGTWTCQFSTVAGPDCMP